MQDHVRFVVCQPIGCARCVGYTCVCLTNDIEIVPSAHFCSIVKSEKFFGLARSDYLNVLGKGWDRGGIHKKIAGSKKSEESSTCFFSKLVFGDLKSHPDGCRCHIDQKYKSTMAKLLFSLIYV